MEMTKTRFTPEQIICQNTVAPGVGPPLSVTTAELPAVVSVLPIWKTNWAFGSPRASRKSVPVNWADDEKK